MKTYKSLFLFMIIITICFILRSCIGGPNPLEDFLIKVDSIHVPNAITSNTPFDIEFFGTIGWDGCHSFKTFNQIYKNNDITIEAWGTYDNKAGICPTVMVFLDGRKLNITIPITGIYNIKIKEPDNTSLVKQITVN